MKRALAALLALHAAVGNAVEAPNAVTISPRLVTSGQPTVRSLASLRDEGIVAVVQLVPSTVQEGVPQEAELLREQGIRHVKLPVDWRQPGDADYDAFAAAMKSLPDGKVLVHCQVNMIASSMTFLYRAIELREPPDKAYDSVAAVWSPNAVWKRFLTDQLARGKVAFEPY